tara:strand:- start:15 stop:221 length:207 start_codon:yes stop_codon:yes gene_type:complete
MKKGDLIYAPADVTLCKFGNDLTVTQYHKLQKPVHLLFLEEEPLLYRVLYEDDRWFVKKNEVYEVKNE